MTRSLRHWSLVAAASGAAVIAAICFVDYPLARAVARLHPLRSLFQGVPVDLPVMVLAAVAGLAAGSYYLLLQKPVPKWAAAAMLAGLALISSLMIVALVLKPLFGRAVPGEFLAHSHAGFFWFDRSPAYRSFPSGHADQAAAILSVLWFLYPGWRWAYIGAFAVLAAALIVGEWHFLSDIIAGGLIGAAAGTLAIRVWQAQRPA